MYELYAGAMMRAVAAGQAATLAGSGSGHQPDESGPQGLEGIDSEVVGPIDFNSHRPLGARHSNVYAEASILCEKLVFMGDAHEVQLLRHIHVESTVQRQRSRFYPTPTMQHQSHQSPSPRLGALRSNVSTEASMLWQVLVLMWDACEVRLLMHIHVALLFNVCAAVLIHTLQRSTSRYIHTSSVICNWMLHTVTSLR